MNNLTELQQKLLEYYKTYYKQHRTNPSLKEVAEYFKTTRQTVSTRAESLVNKGYLKKVRQGVYIHTLKK